jgi:hypothetical protein
MAVQPTSAKAGTATSAPAAAVSPKSGFCMCPARAQNPTSQLPQISSRPSPISLSLAANLPIHHSNSNKLLLLPQNHLSCRPSEMASSSTTVQPSPTVPSAGTPVSNDTVRSTIQLSCINCRSRRHGSTALCNGLAILTTMQEWCAKVSVLT